MSKEFPDIAFVNVDGQAVPFTKPQHYKKGSTTDTLLTGEDNPLPTKDESVEARLQAIEQTQSQILDKLNDTIDTRLTGSNDEYVMPVKESSKNQEVITVYENFECPTGTIKILDYYDVGEFKEFFLQVTPGGLEDYRLFYYIRRNNRDVVLGREIVADRDNAQNFTSDRMQVNSNRIAVAVENRTESDHEFREIVFVGVRR